MERLWGGEAWRSGIGNDLGGMREHMDWHTAALLVALEQWYAYTPDEGRLYDSMDGIGGIIRRHRAN